MSNDEEKISSLVEENLSLYRKRAHCLSQLKKIFIEKVLSKEEEKEYMIAFQKMDINNDG